eukprot:scaffold8439_cov51-Phaeocystis_antarctica.AAC.2
MHRACTERAPRKCHTTHSRSTCSLAPIVAYRAESDFCSSSFSWCCNSGACARGPSKGSGALTRCAPAAAARPSGRAVTGGGSEARRAAVAAAAAAAAAAEAAEAEVGTGVFCGAAGCAEGVVGAAAGVPTGADLGVGRAGSLSSGPSSSSSPASAAATAASIAALVDAGVGASVAVADLAGPTVAGV